MPDITLSGALAALIADLRASTSADLVGGVEVELGVVAVPDQQGGVRWRVAVGDDVPAHRVRVTVQPGAAWNPPPLARSTFDETLVGIDPRPAGNSHLPPIVRPKPGIDVDRDGR